MASRIFKPSRILSVALVLAAGAWIASGVFAPEHEDESGAASSAVAAEGGGEGDSGPPEVSVPLQKVSVTRAASEMRGRDVILSCETEAKNRASAVARGAGVIVELSISRGDVVRAGDVLAVISDEGRKAAVSQAQALLDQREAEYAANKTLIDRGDAPRNRLPQLEAVVAAAEAAVAAAEAEADRVLVKAPIGGIVDSVPAQVGQAVQIGMEIAEIVDPDPMLAVGAVSENRRGSIRPGQKAAIRFVGGGMVEGEVNFVGLSADKATRTYPVEATIENANAAIADGVTCEMAVALEPIEAAAVPRSSLVFSDDGHLGIRIADAEGRVQFVPIEIVDDGLRDVWVSGLTGEADVIIVGQDFVKSGDLVEAISASDTETAAEPPA